MATVTGTLTKHPTLSTTTVDTVTMSGGVHQWLVGNRTGTADLWVTYTLDGSTPTTPTVEGDNCYVVPPGMFKVFYSPRGGIKLKVLGNANKYSVEGSSVEAA